MSLLKFLGIRLCTLLFTALYYVLSDSVRPEGLGEVFTEVPVLVVAGPEPSVVVVEVLMVLRSSSSGEAPDVSHQRFVLRPAVGVVELPAAVTEIVEAGFLTTEVGTLLHGAHAAQSVLQVGVHLTDHTS